MLRLMITLVPNELNEYAVNGFIILFELCLVRVKRESIIDVYTHIQSNTHKRKCQKSTETSVSSLSAAETFATYYKSLIIPRSETQKTTIEKG